MRRKRLNKTLQLFLFDLDTLTIVCVTLMSVALLDNIRFNTCEPAKFGGAVWDRLGICNADEGDRYPSPPPMRNRQKVKPAGIAPVMGTAEISGRYGNRSSRVSSTLTSSTNSRVLA